MDQRSPMSNGHDASARFLRLEQALSETSSELAVNSTKIEQVVSAIERLECSLGTKLDEVVKASMTQERRLSVVESVIEKARERKEFVLTRIFLPVGLVVLGVFAREIGTLAWMILAQ